MPHSLGLYGEGRALPLIVPVSKVAAVAGLAAAFIYAWLAGFQIPAQRTMYMVGVVAFALWTGRNPRSFDIWWWALALALVLIVDPMAPYTPGFWLSFGAVAAILYAMGDSSGLLGIPTGKELEVYWAQRIMQALREACRVQEVVTLALLPLTLFWFYQVSMVSPLANAFAILLVSYIVTPLAIASALLPEFAGRWLIVPAHASMEYLAIALEWMASWVWDGVEFLIWHPHEDAVFAEQYPGKSNEMSCVLEVRNQQSSLWLTGDIEKQGEADIDERLTTLALRDIGNRDLIFMAPHHGSKTSSSLALLKKLAPDQAFAQNGYRNRYGHSHPDVVSRYQDLKIPFYQTPQTGAQTWLFKDNKNLRHNFGSMI